jgi:PAS domain S-box-containing protein
MKNTRDKLKLFATGFLPFLLILAIGLGWAQYYTARTFTENISNNLMEVTQQEAAELERKIDDLIYYAQHYSSSPDLLTALQDEDVTSIQQFLEHKEGLRSVERTVIVTPSGYILADSPHDPLELGRNVAEREWFKGVATTGEPYVSGMYLRIAQPRRHTIAVAVPIKMGEEVVGFLQIFPAMDKLFATVKEKETGAGGMVYVVDRNGNLVSHSSKEVDQLINYESVPPVESLLRGEMAYGIYFNPMLEEERLGNWLWLDKYPLGVVTSENLKEVLAPVRHLRLVLGITAALILAFSALVFYRLIMGREEIRRTNQALQQRVRQEKGFRKILLLFDQSYPDLKTLMENILLLLMNQLEAISSVFYLVGEGERLHPLAEKGTPGNAPFFDPGAGLVGRALQEKVIIRSGYLEEENHLSVPTGQGNLFPREIIAFPLKNEGEVLGVIELGTRRLLMEQEVGWLKTVAEQVAVGVASFQYRQEYERQRLLNQTMMDSIPALVFLKDAAGTYQAFNVAFMQELQKSPEEIRDKTTEELFTREWAEALLSAEGEVLTAGESAVKEICFPGTDSGKKRWFLVTLTPLAINGSPGGIVGILREITPLKEYEVELEEKNSLLEKQNELLEEQTAELEAQQEELEAQQEELEAQNEELEAQNEQLVAHQQEIELLNTQLEEVSRAKSDFLANMSHELRTPLNSILGFSEVLEDELAGFLNDKQKEYVDYIYSSGKHLLSLINDVLDLSKVEAGKMELELEEVNLSELLQMPLNLLKEKAFQKNIIIKEEISPDLPARINADERKVRQVIFNLISNAVKFTPKDGTIIVRASRKANSGGTDPSPGDYLQLDVEDNGIGIDLEDREKIFSEFYQLESPHTKHYEGTGLGLALSKRLAELHGGHIFLKSEKDKGSCFSFTIPLQGPDPAK